MVQIENFGTCTLGPVRAVTLTDGTGCRARFLTLGAILQSLEVPDREGRLVDVCLGYDTAEAYLENNGHFGGCIGRCANRIGGASFALNGRTYALPANEGANHIHGGAETCFDRRLWGVAARGDSAVFTLTSPDGEGGYPGTARITVTYTLREGCLHMEYQAESDADTLMNLTNHAYFNLAGHDGGPVLDHVLTVRAGRYTPTGGDKVPTGELAGVEGTALDLRQGAVLEDRLGDPFLAWAKGYDHNMVLDGGEAPAAELYCPRTGIALEMQTTLEGMQLYTAGGMSPRAGKGGVMYGPSWGVCLETQHFPDAIHHSNFPSPVLRVGGTYCETTSYRFTVR